MDEAVTMTMATLLTTISTVFGSIIKMVGTVATTVADNPLLLIGCIIPLAGCAIGFFSRLKNL